MEEKQRTIEEVRKIFANDKFATENGAVIEEIGELYAKCSITLGDIHKNAMGGLMGGVPFVLADFAFAVANNHEEMRTVSLSSNIAYVGVAKGERLIAEAFCVKNGRTTCYYRIEVKDELENRVAEVTITGFHK